MNNDQQVRQQISELADGELDPPQLRCLLDELRKPAHRADWDLYHHIGDTLRSEPMARDLSADFSRRFAERLAAEPTLMAPASRKPAGGLRGWGAALAAVAAGATGFALSPAVFHSAGDERDAGPSFASSSLASSSIASGADTSGRDTSVRREKAVLPASGEGSEYILMHVSANPSLYGAPALARSAALGSTEDQ